MREVEDARVRHLRTRRPHSTLVTKHASHWGAAPHRCEALLIDAHALEYLLQRRVEVRLAAGLQADRGLSLAGCARHSQASTGTASHCAQRSLVVMFGFLTCKENSRQCAHALNGSCGTTRAAGPAGFADLHDDRGLLGDAQRLLHRTALLRQLEHVRQRGALVVANQLVQALACANAAASSRTGGAELCEGTSHASSGHGAVTTRLGLVLVLNTGVTDKARRMNARRAAGRTCHVELFVDVCSASQVVSGRQAPASAPAHTVHVLADDGGKCPCTHHQM